MSPVKNGIARIEFLSIKPEVNELIVAGHNAKSIYKSFADEGRITILHTHKSAILEAIKALAANPATMRSLTDFYHLVQHAEIKGAIQHYTQKGAMGQLLDALY